MEQVAPGPRQGARGARRRHRGAAAGERRHRRGRRRACTTPCTPSTTTRSAFAEFLDAQGKTARGVRRGRPHGGRAQRQYAPASCSTRSPTREQVVGQRPGAHRADHLPGPAVPDAAGGVRPAHPGGRPARRDLLRRAPQQGADRGRRARPPSPTRRAAPVDLSDLLGSVDEPDERRTTSTHGRHRGCLGGRPRRRGDGRGARRQPATEHRRRTSRARPRWRRRARLGRAGRSARGRPGGSAYGVRRPGREQAGAAHSEQRLRVRSVTAPSA